jgi:hypothetical protein
MGKHGKRANAPRGPERADVDAALGRVRTALLQRGLLLLQDAELPAATTLIVGEVVRGSWWGHPQNKLVYATLQQLGADVLWVKLVRGKETIVARSLWPALLSMACSREAWQLRGLSASDRRLLELVDAAPAPLRLDQVVLPAGEDAPRELARALEGRLLVHSGELHTETGRHVKVLESWATWQRTHGVSDLLEPAEGRATLEAAVQDWPKPRLHRSARDSSHHRSTSHGLYRADARGADGGQEATDGADCRSGKDGDAEMGQAGRETKCHFLPGGEVHTAKFDHRCEQGNCRADEGASEAERRRLDDE